MKDKNGNVTLSSHEHWTLLRALETAANHHATEAERRRSDADLQAGTPEWMLNEWDVRDTGMAEEFSRLRWELMNRAQEVVLTNFAEGNKPPGGEEPGGKE